MTSLVTPVARQVIQNSQHTIQMVAVLEIVRLAVQASTALWIQRTPHGVVVKCSTGQLGVLPNQILVRDVPEWLFPNTTSVLNPTAIGRLSAWLEINSIKPLVFGLAIQQNQSALWLLEAQQTDTAPALLEQTVRLLRTFDEPAKTSDKDFGRSIAQSIPTPICVTDQIGRIGYINPAFTSLLGYELGELYLRPLSELVYEDDLSHLTQDMAVRRFRVLTQTEQFLWVEMCSYPRLDQQQQVVGQVSTLREIGEEMQTQERLFQIETDLKRIQSHVSSGSGFQGRLETCDGVAGLLQMLVTNGSEGAVVLDDSMVFLEQGRIVGVQHPKLEGNAAAQHLIQRQAGVFQFFPNVKTDHPTLAIDPTSLILHYAHTSDEHLHRTSSSGVHEILLPDANTAKTFLRGIGERQLRSIRKERSNVVLETPYLRMVVQTARLEDFDDLR